MKSPNVGIERSEFPPPVEEEAGGTVSKSRSLLSRTPPEKAGDGGGVNETVGDGELGAGVVGGVVVLPGFALLGAPVEGPSDPAAGGLDSCEPPEAAITNMPATTAARSPKTPVMTAAFVMSDCRAHHDVIRCDSPPPYCWLLKTPMLCTIP